MQVRSDGAERQTESERDLLVGLFFLMIEDEHGSFDVAEAAEFAFDLLLELAVGDLLFGVRAGVREAIVPAGDLVRERGERPIDAAAAFPLVPGDVDGDAIEVGGEGGWGLLFSGLSWL